MEHTYSRKTGVNPCAVNLFYFFNSREGERERDDLVPILAEWRRRKKKSYPQLNVKNRNNTRQRNKKKKNKNVIK
jgi:hypothetical protein